jgi:hypothetical protein
VGEHIKRKFDEKFLQEMVGQFDGARRKAAVDIERNDAVMKFCQWLIENVEFDSEEKKDGI